MAPRGARVVRRQDKAEASEPEAAPDGGVETVDEEVDPVLAEEQRVFRVAGVTYLHIPSRDAHESSEFFHKVFGWHLRGDPERPTFDDGTGHVLGTWVTYRPVAPEAGILPYIYVESVDQTLDKVCAAGGEITSLPFQEGDLWVATFTDPSGNAFGIWQRGPRR